MAGEEGVWAQLADAAVAAAVVEVRVADEDDVRGALERGREHGVGGFRQPVSTSMLRSSPASSY